MKLKENDYAKVAERVKEFRQDTTHASIETKPTFLENGVVSFTAVIIKDLRDPASARGTGNSLGTAKGVKDFEKLETVAIGRALANMGYLASGEIASFEEMEEFEKMKDEKNASQAEVVIKDLKTSKTFDELKDKFNRLKGSIKARPEVIKAKEDMKKKLTPKVKKEVKVEEGEVDPALLPPDLK